MISKLRCRVVLVLPLLVPVLPSFIHSLFLPLQEKTAQEAVLQALIRELRASWPEPPWRLQSPHTQHCFGGGTSVMSLRQSDWGCWLQVLSFAETQLEILFFLPTLIFFICELKNMFLTPPPTSKDGLLRNIYFWRFRHLCNQCTL